MKNGMDVIVSFTVEPVIVLISTVYPAVSQSRGWSVFPIPERSNEIKSFSSPETHGSTLPDPQAVAIEKSTVTVLA